MFHSDQDFTPPENLYDFRSWMEILSKIDVNDTSTLTGQTSQLCQNNFNTFLKTFPWLHKYWTKLANFVWSTKCDIRLSEQVFINALSKGKLLYSVDMWLEYIKFFQTHLAAASQDEMRRIFADALDSVGSLYNSSEIWHLALNFENEHKRTRFFLLSKVITYPVSQLKQFWAELQTILPRVPIGQLRQFDANLRVSDLFKLTDQPQNNVVLPPNAETQAREEITTKLSNIYSASLESLSKRYRYEINITRQYFDFNCPDEIQIGNWEAYTSMLIDEYQKNQTWNNYNAVVQCFERAVIPCAYVDSIWLNYANFIEDASLGTKDRNRFASIDDAREIYRRIPYQVLPSAKIVFSEFEEVYEPKNATALYNEMAASDYAEQIIASAYYSKRSHGEKEAIAVLHAGINHLKEIGDQEGASVVAAALLNIANQATEDVHSPIYLSEYARKILTSEPGQSNSILFELTFNNNDKKYTLEERILLFDIYLQYARANSVSAEFQLNVENQRNKLRNKLIFNKDYFNNEYMINERPPEQKSKQWIETSSNS